MSNTDVPWWSWGFFPLVLLSLPLILVVLVFAVLWEQLTRRDGPR